MAAQRLSNPNEDPIFDKRVFTFQNLNLSSLITLNQKANTQPIDKTWKASDDWREIVRKRIELKTKYKKQPSLRKYPIKMKENKYSECYGYFFFPLIRPYDK